MRVVVVAALLSVVVGFVQSTVQAWDSYRALLPNGNNVLDDDDNVWPGVGHSRMFGGGPTNSFGRDFGKAGFKWTKELCQKDSDGDGKTNGEELGDPDCVWKQGAKPKYSCATHPGLKNDPDM